MANGYLGKISAVVSANTADFQSKLNASAKDVQAFARSVQSNLTSASREAARSFEGIYTPLQKFERSLQAASSMKLSFKGFAGAIKDVDVLRQRLTSMRDSQVSVAVRASGMKNVTELREALVGLRAKDLDIVARVGGIEKVRELRALSSEKRVDFAVNLVDSGLGRRLAEAKSRVAELKAEVASVKIGGSSPAGGVSALAAQYREATAEVTRLQEVGRQTIKATIGVNVQKDADVDRILQAGERAEAVRLPVILDVLGEAAIKEAVTQTQRIRSVAEQINKPFGEATQKLAAMSAEIQAGFLPAMKRSQSQIESLKSNIEKGVLPASAIAQQFDVVEKRASAAAAAVARLAEASSKIGNMKTGQELLFARPALASSLDRGVEMGNKAAGLPASTIQANPRIAAILEEYKSRSNDATAAYARLQAKIASGLPTGSAERQLESLQARMAALGREFDGIYAAAAPDRNADRIGDSSPMDRNAENIGARTSLGAMGARTDISGMGRSSPLDRNFGSFGARTSLVGQGERTDISDMGRMSSLEDRRRQLARQAMGDDLELPRRQLATLAGSITSLKSQIDTLPEPLRARFVPAIREAEAEFIRLSAAPAALPAEIEAARQRLVHMTQEATRAAQAMNFSQSFGGAGATGVNLGLDQRALQGYNAQLQILQGAIGRASAEARGPAIEAFNRLRNAVASAFDEGNIDSAENRRRLAEVRAEAIAAAAAVSGISVGRLTRDVSRAGDVGRQGFDRFSLALNQAAFAVDDFMSSTGGLEFKLRAVSNNITQMAFVLGGTTGLFVGLGAVIAGQAAIGLIKWANSGRSAEDQAKALNESLARQKSLVDDLAQSHKALADAILRGTASSSSEQARSIAFGRSAMRRQSAELAAERRDGTDSAAVAPMPISQMIRELYSPRERRNEFQGMAELRAEINKLQKQLEAATTVGEGATIQGRIRDTNRALFATRGRLASEVTPDANVVASSIRGSANESDRVNNDRFLGNNTQRMFSNIVTLGASALLGVNRARSVQANASNEGLRDLASQVPTSVQGQIQALRRAQEMKRPEQSQRDLGFIKTGAALAADREIAQFEALIKSLQKVVESGVVDSASKAYAASVDAADSIRAAQEDVADAIRRGVPSAIAFQSELDALSSELAAADDALRSAVSTSPDDANITPEARTAAIERAQERVNGVLRQRADVESRAREMRLGRTFGGERTTKALSSLEGNDRFANEQAGLIANLKRVIDDEAEARRKAVQAVARETALVDLIAKKREEAASAGGDIGKRKIAEADIKAAEADLEKAKAAREAASAASDLAQKASETAAALAEATAGIEAALTRIRKVGESALQRSEQGADAAQRAFEENPLRAGAREARDAAEERLINDRATVGNAQADLGNRRREIQQDPQMQAINGELEAITQRRKDLEAKSAVGGGLNQAESAELDAAAKREIELLRQREMMARQLTEAERKQLDAINNGILAREKELEKGRQRAAEDPTFKRSIDAANQIMADSERQANEAQQRYINNPTEKNRKERDEADARLRSDRQRAQELQDNLDNKRKEIEKDPAVAANNKAIAANDKRLADLAEKEAKGGLTDLEIEERKRIQGENRRMRGENEGAIDAGTRDERKSIDDEQYARNQRDRALRGRDLGMTDRERFRKEFTEGAGADINARAAEMRANGEDPTKFLRQALRNQMEQVAPMLKQFQDERQTAALQGPSRAALNVSDVSTSQGASELTRLLRGDDSAKDVNLAELQKQTGYLADIRADLKANNPGVLL
jgi:hypothetical protein